MLTDNGFEVVHMSYAGSYRSLDNIFYNNFMLRKKWNWVYNLVKFLGLSRLDLYMNLYDIVYVIARRKP